MVSIRWLIRRACLILCKCAMLRPIHFHGTLMPSFHARTPYPRVGLSFLCSRWTGSGCRRVEVALPHLLSSPASTCTPQLLNSTPFHIPPRTTPPQHFNQRTSCVPSSSSPLFSSSPCKPPSAFSFPPPPSLVPSPPPFVPPWPLARRLRNGQRPPIKSSRWYPITRSCCS